MKICSRTSTWWVFFDLLSCYSHIALKVTNFHEYYVNYIWCLYKRKEGLCSLCFQLLPQQMSQSKKKCMNLCQQANKYKQVVFETISWMFNGIQRVTYVAWAVKSVRHHNKEL